MIDCTFLLVFDILCRLPNHHSAMLDNLNIANVLFIDVETVSGYATYDRVPERIQQHWKKKCRFLLRTDEEQLEDDMLVEAYTNKAAIFAEFGKVVCISIGYLVTNSMELRLKSFCSADEAGLLSEFADLMNRHYNDPARNLICGHNIREFDIPYLCRRFMINNIPLPDILQIAGRKPWETKHLVDTMQLWKFGDIKNYTSLDLLAAVFDIDTPKDDIDGSMVGRVFWDDEDLDRIAMYCEKDVVTVAQVLLKMKGMPLVMPDKVVSV